MAPLQKPLKLLLSHTFFWGGGRRVETLTQGVERGNVLPHVSGLLGVRLPHESVHVMSEAEARHLRRADVDCEQVLVAAQVHLQRDGPEGNEWVRMKAKYNLTLCYLRASWGSVTDTLSNLGIKPSLLSFSSPSHLPFP